MVILKPFVKFNRPFDACHPGLLGLLEAHECFEFRTAYEFVQVGILGLLRIVRTQKDNAVCFGLCRMEYDFFECIVLETSDTEIQARALEWGFFNRIDVDFASLGVCLGDGRIGIMPESVAEQQCIAIRGTANAHGMATFIFI